MTTTQPEITDVVVVEDDETKSNLPAVIDEKSAELAGVHGTLATIANDPWADVDDGEIGKRDEGGIAWVPTNRKLDGGWVDPISGEVDVRELEFIWMAKGTSRVLFDGAYDPKKEPKVLCRSFDGIRPDPGSDEVQSETCATCPHSQWIEGKQACRESIEALVMLPDGVNGGQLARMRFSGIAFKAARDYWRTFKNRLPKRPAIAFLTRATLEPVETDNGKFLSPKFERVAELSRAEADPIIQERDRRLVEWHELVAEDVADLRAQDVVDGPDKGDPFADEHVAADSEAPAGDDVAPDDF